jgi:hypothetical protein
MSKQYFILYKFHIYFIVVVCMPARPICIYRGRKGDRGREWGVKQVGRWMDK